MKQLDQLWAEVQKRQAEFEKCQEAGELTDEELEAVSGGITPTFILFPVLATVTIAGAAAGTQAAKAAATGQTLW